MTLAANTVGLADITIRGEPDNQVYTREFDLSGSVDPGTGDGVMMGTISGTDLLFSGDAATPITSDASGELIVLCDDDEPSGFVIAGFAAGNGALEFEARP